MEGTLFTYKMLLKCILNIISIKCIMNSVRCSFQLSRCQTGESTSTTVYQTGRLQWKLVSSLCFSRILCVLLINPSLYFP
ncbi:hypothetical protein AMTRI_Chr01g126180 [Amborella trichopoda]